MDLRYPIGKFQRPAAVSDAERTQFIETIATTPDALRSAVHRLDDSQLDTPYRADGWTVRQVVHHVADSHMNAFIRFKLALTEATPTIKPYNETEWAKLPDAVQPIAASLTLLDALHARWVPLMRGTAPDGFARTFIHPERPETATSLDVMTALYAWHGRHHVAHITSLRERMGW